MDKDLIATPVTLLVCSKCRHEMNVEGREPFTTVACETCGTPLTVPVMLGTFLLLERMGAGGMGAVYRALDTGLNRFVAIKVMKAALGEDKKLVESFLREAQAAAALNHRNIVQIYSCGQERGQPYIVMELVTGGKMSDLFTKEQPIEEALLLKICRGVTDGLSAANGAGLVHGDIKPENILMDQDGTPKIVDFGLAQFVNAQKDRGEIWGTPYYISPERARGNKADHRSDIYSLGATMFHALAGTPPFDGKTPADVVLARLKHPPPSLAELRPGLQKQTVDLIDRMMAADPFLRYPTSASLKSDMQAALDAADAAKKSLAHPHAKKSNRPSVVIGVVAVGLVAALGLYFVAKVREEGARPVPVVERKPAVTEPAKKESAPEVTFRREEQTARDGNARTRMVVEIFPPADEAKLLEAARAASRFDHAAAYRLYYDLRGDLDVRRSPRIAWLNLLSSIVRRIEGNQSEVTKLQDFAKRANIDEREEKDPALMPKVLARYLAGEITREEVLAFEQEWPVWFSYFREFAEGMQQISRHELVAAVPHFEVFLQAPPDTPTWISAYQPVASYWRSIQQGIDDQQQELRRRIDAGDAAAARAAYKAYHAALPLGAFRALASFDKEIAGIEGKQKQAADEVAARKHRVEVQKELDQLDAIVTEFLPAALRSRDFRRAVRSMSTRVAGMKTAEGREAAQQLTRQLEELDALKLFLIRAADAQRFTRADGSGLNGDVVAATALGVRVSLDGRSVTTINWDELPLLSLVRMAEFYTRSERFEAAERARALSGLALFSLMNGAFEPAANFARRAVELDSAQAVHVRKLMPGLIP